MENFNDYQKVELLRNLNKFYRKILNSVDNPIGEIDIYNLGSISTIVSNTIYSILEGMSKMCELIESELPMTFEEMFNKKSKEIHEEDMKNPEYVKSHTTRMYEIWKDKDKKEM